jgi:hypothetical protein
MDASRDLRPDELRRGAAGLKAWFWGLLLVLIDFHIGAKPNLTPIRSRIRSGGG